MSKHTAGPWVIDTETRPAEVCTIHGVPPQGEDGQCWVYVRGALGDWEATEETNLANARLIASAPDLLAALKVAKTFIAESGCSGSFTYMKVSAAIAKATGSAS